MEGGVEKPTWLMLVSTAAERKRKRERMVGKKRVREGGLRIRRFFAHRLGEGAGATGAGWAVRRRGGRERRVGMPVRVGRAGVTPEDPPAAITPRGRQGTPLEKMLRPLRV